MARIGIVHPDLTVRGGAEDVCMHALQALQADHDLTLLTLIEPDVAGLNAFFRTDVTDLEIEPVAALAQDATRATGHRLARLKAAVLGRYVRRRRDAFDLVISTKNEFGLAPPAIQYVHSPNFASADPGLAADGTARSLYRGLCRRVAGVDPSTLEATTVLANSNWTAATFQDAYGVAARTVYPPVETAVFGNTPWREREPGFVCIGRIGPSKHVLRNVDIVTRLHRRGHDVHLHVVGPTTDGSYAERVIERTRDLPFVSIEGAVERERLVDLVTGHRYGLHGRPYEHFGIAVAELVAGGAIAFAPDSGGQREILDDDRLLYRTVDDAVERIDRVLSDAALQSALREDLAGAADRFSRDRFERSFLEAVNAALCG